MGLIDTVYTENHEIIEWLHLMTGYSFEQISQADKEFVERLSVHLSFKYAEKYDEIIDRATIQAIIDKKKKGKNKTGLFSKFEILSKLTGKNQGTLKQTADFHNQYEQTDMEIGDKIKKEAERAEREFKKATFLQKIRKK
ncbi:hypothetical protein [Lactococcus allomyrinae]|uniref:Uncharacterized protein n=1 Tax=Lactococcus allomyrinae TaxID=2419773 RepID=A0A387BHG2_9LACT|nr:hypothetical protein [Lactococcus allomyrinae]AYG01704.1 hypothetical protein D7I46_11955 [Lactococcus allomyrinae]